MNLERYYKNDGILRKRKRSYSHWETSFIIKLRTPNPVAKEETWALFEVEPFWGSKAWETYKHWGGMAE